MSKRDSKTPPTSSQQSAASTSKDEDLALRQKIRMELLQFMAEQNAQTHAEGPPSRNVEVVPFLLSLPKTLHDTTIDLKKKESEKQQEANDFYKAGDVVDGRYLVATKLKDGGFGQVYKAIDNKTTMEIALKIEKNFNVNSPGEYFEGVVFKAFQGHTNCPRMFAVGFVSNYIYIAMQLLGDNLSEIRRSCSLTPARFSISASYRTAIQCLNATEGLHNLGFIHRDIKPSNFVVGKEPKLSSIVYMLDFGLCRYYVNRDGSLKKPRENVGFRGTVRYASLTAHEKKDLSRVDDIVSLFYLFVELLTGQLPWRKTNDKEKVAQMKKRYSPDVLCQVLPLEVVEFVKSIENLSFTDKPDYSLLSTYLKRHLLQVPTKMEDPYDWQISDCSLMTHWFPPTIPFGR